MNTITAAKLRQQLELVDHLTEKLTVTQSLSEGLGLAARLHYEEEVLKRMLQRLEIEDTIRRMEANG